MKGRKYYHQMAGLFLSTVILMIVLVGCKERAISTKDIENTPEDYLSGSVLINARDGIYSVDLKTGQKSRFFRESGPIELHDNEIYICLFGRRTIYVKNIEGKILRSIQLPKEVTGGRKFAVLPDGRIAISDNRNDRVYFIDQSGKHLKTVELLEKSNGRLQNMHLIVAKDKLLVSENGFKEIVQIDISSYEVSLLRRLPELRPWLGAIDYDKGRYYICDSKSVYSFAEDSEEVKLIATVPQNNITGIKIVGKQAFVIVNGQMISSGETTKYSGALYRVDLETGEISTIIEGLARPKDMEMMTGNNTVAYDLRKVAEDRVLPTYTEASSQHSVALDEPAKIESRKAEHTAPMTTKFDVPEENLRIPEEMQTCAANLHKIYEAIKKYEKDKVKLPDWLSDLVPDYLSSERLLCPSNDSLESAFPPDPRLPCSYGWQFSAKPIPTAWDATGRTLYRDWKTQQMQLFGDVVPMVRCYHHESRRVLNLSVGGKIWWSPRIWEPMFRPDYASIHKQMLSKTPASHPTNSVPLESVPPSSSLIGKLAPSFTLQDLNGKQVSLSDFKGKVVLLDFWGTWCGPCRRAIPHMEALYRKYRDEGLVVIGINKERDHDKVKAFAKEQMSYVVVLDADEQFEEYGISGIPAVYYIGREGKIRYCEIGFGPGKEDELEQRAKELLVGKQEVANGDKSLIEEVSWESAIEGAKALSGYNKAIELDPKDANAYYGRGNAYLYKREFDKAISDFGKAIELDSTHTHAYHNRGGAYYNKGEYDKAISDYSKAIELDPKDAKAYFGRGDAYSYQAKYDKAILDYSKSIELGHKCAKAYFNRGRVYFWKSEYDKTILDFNKVIELDPKCGEAYYARGRAYYNKSEYDKAILDCNKVIELDPKYAKAYCGRGDAYSCQAKYDKAISDYSKAIELDPRIAEAYYARGSAYFYQAKYDKAISDYGTAIELDPKYSKAYGGRSYTYYKLAGYQQAWNDMANAEELGFHDFPRDFKQKLRNSLLGEKIEEP